MLWDADGVLQSTPAQLWDLAVQVVGQIPGALTGAAIDEQLIRGIAHDLGIGDRTEDILAVWSTFEFSSASLQVVAQVRSAGTSCYLATNQDAYRASWMREDAAYSKFLDGGFYSCDIGVAKPSIAFFEHIITDLGLFPGHLLFIDDQPVNVAGARSAGLRAEHWAHHDGVARLREILHTHGIRLV